MFFSKELDLYSLFVFASIFKFLVAITLFIFYLRKEKSIPKELILAIFLIGCSHLTHAFEISKYFHGGIFFPLALFLSGLHLKTSSLIIIKTENHKKKYADLIIFMGLTVLVFFFPANTEAIMLKYLLTVSTSALIYYTFKIYYSKIDLKDTVSRMFFWLYVAVAVVSLAFLLFIIDRKIEFLNRDTNYLDRLLFILYFVIEYFIIFLLIYALVEKMILSTQSFEKKYHILKKELNHRFANSINQILSLIELSNVDKDLESNTIRKKNLINRITAISEVHKKLYDSKKTDSVETKTYLRDLIEKIIESFDLQKKVEVCCEGDDIYLKEELAVKIGLAFNELALNSCKYAFNDREEGKILIRTNLLKRDKNYENREVSICYQDDGPGYQDNEVAKGFGKRFLEHMVSFLNANVVIETNGRFSYEMVFPYPERKDLQIGQKE